MSKNKKNGKNIILITIDSLRADHLSCMGYKKNITPTIDRLAKTGILFKNAISNAPYTSYSVPSFISSNIPPIRGKIKHTIAYVLKENGYSTAAFNPNTIIFSDTLEGCNILSGFDKFDLMLNYNKQCRLTIGFLRMELMKYFRTKFKEEKMIYKTIYKYYIKLLKILPSILTIKEYNIVPNAESINTQAVSWIKNQKDKFFLWLHYMDVHEPYAPIENYDKKELLYLISKYRDFPNMLTSEETKKIIDLYDLKIKYTDNAINNFLKNLKKENQLDNSIVIISSDHGEAFGEHKYLGHGGQFKVQLYDEYIKVPLIIWGLDKKEVIERQVQLLDLSPTICDILNIPIPKSFLGTSFFNKPNDGIIINSEYDIAFRSDDYKLIISKADNKKNELYYLKNDPFEEKNIYDITNLNKQIEKDMIKLLKSYKNKNNLIKIPEKIANYKNT
jgi:arylsulfatase A-like enzyme